MWFPYSSLESIPRFTLSRGIIKRNQWASCSFSGSSDFESGLAFGPLAMCVWATLMENEIFLEDDDDGVEEEEAATALHCWWTSSTLTSRLAPLPPSPVPKKKTGKKIKTRWKTHFTTHRKPTEGTFLHWRWYVGAYIVVLPAVVLVVHAHATPSFPASSPPQDRLEMAVENYDAFVCCLLLQRSF